MRVTKQFKFHAAHRDVEAADQCGRLHGHTYLLEVSVAGMLPTGGRMLLHGDILKEVYKEKIEPLVEHHCLNETLPFNPTMELLAVWCWTQVDQALRDRGIRLKAKIKLWETPTMYTEYP